ncbi:MAG: hypothetical protein HC906_06225 [Bacteroidales bacterium]|nr:hypothetical protein [Bacteroidales bacterium]
MYKKNLQLFSAKKKLYLYCLYLIAFSALGFYFIKPDDVIMLFTLQVIFSIASAPPIVLLWSMYADTADYSEWKTGRRATGLIFSASTFAQKFGMAAGGAILMWLLSYFGICC